MSEKFPLTKRDYLYSYGFMVACYIGIFYMGYNNEISFFANILAVFLATSILILIGYLIGLLQLIQGLFMISCEILFFISRLMLKLFKKLFKPNQEKPKNLDEILSNKTKNP